VGREGRFRKKSQPSRESKIRGTEEIKTVSKTAAAVVGIGGRNIVFVQHISAREHIIIIIVRLSTKLDGDTNETIYTNIIDRNHDINRKRQPVDFIETYNINKAYNQLL